MTHSKSISWTIAAASFGFTIVQLDVTIVNVALPQLSAALSSGVAGLQWVVDAYTLAFAVFLLSAGVLGDRLGARRAYLLGLVIFALTSLMCGAAQTITQLIVARAMQGMGAALLVPSSLSLINHACGHDNKLRAHAIGLWTAAGGVSIAAGPIVGGFLLEGLGWRSIFLVNLPVCVIGIIMCLRIGETARKLQHRFDWSGQLFAMLALIGLTGAVIESGSLGWRHPLILSGLVLALLSGGMFARSQAKATQPILPLRFFRLPNFSAAIVFGIAVNLAYYGIIFVLSLYLQHIKQYSATETGLAYLPLTATFIVSNLMSGWTMGRYGVRVPMVSGAAIATLGYALLIPLNAHSAYLAMLLPFVLIPGGMGLAVPAMTATILSSVEKSWSGTASAVLNAARQAGGTIGVAAFGGFVAGTHDHIVPGLQLAATLSSAVLLMACLIVWFGIREIDDQVSADFHSEKRTI
ncbi:MAG: MFS transporter [Herbaspirillum sp.]